MLIQFSVKNYLSIRERATLSLVKGTGEELADTNSFDPGAPATPPLLNSCAIYGANAAGKSNIIKALQLMMRLVLQSATKSQAGEKIPVTPFLLDESSNKQPSEFEIAFVSEGVRYQYGFSATRERIMEEWLLAYPKGRPQRLIERAYDESKKATVWGAMDKLTGQKQVWQDATRPNALFLSTAIQLNNQQLKPVFNWFKDRLHVAGIGGWEPDYTISLCEEKETRTKIVDFVKGADTDIDDIEVEKRQFKRDYLPDDMPEIVKSEIEKEFKDKPVVNVKTAHLLKSGKKVLFDMADESDGTRKIFAYAGPWLDSLKNGNVLVIDELHDNLHPLMVKFMVGLFHSKETNPKNAQLIFTTHDTSILNQEVFRRDQIWFCEKNKEHATDLYPLTDFSPRKGAENLEQRYLAGRYGALPYFKNIKIAMDG